MSADNAWINTPAAAWAWLMRQLSDLEKIPGRSIRSEWSKFKSERDGRGTGWSSVGDWPSDYWIAKTQRSMASSQLEPYWAIPERLDQWPMLEVQGPFVDGLLGKKAMTNSAPFLNLLARSDPTHVLSESDPIRRFHDLFQSTTTRGDQANISYSQMMAWLTTAFGNLLRGIVLTSADDDQTRESLIQGVAERISDIDSLPSEHRLPGWFDFGCDNLYTTHLTEGGLQRAFVRQGQDREWQHAWRWLSRPQAAGAMKATLELAGLLLVNEPLVQGLTSAIRDESEHAQKRTLCVTRRWLLTAKALAWLFEALEHNWTWVRPQDLACFAYGALSPAWPRRAVAISHRSAEAKPVLSSLKMWKSPHAAIDASYVPAWETNIGMIWSLFASVPLIVRVESSVYFESEWCRREHEMFQYLIEHADFLEGRAIVDIGVDQLAELDASLFEDGAGRGGASRFKPFSAPQDEFPPWSPALVGEVPSRIDLVILRAAGALRLINAFVQNPALANEVASRAAAGDDIDIEEPTNNPDGWAAYGEVFRDLEALLLDNPVKPSIVDRLRRRTVRRSLALRVPDDYSALDVQQDRLNAEQAPDLSDGQYRLADILAALEWQATVFDWFKGKGYGDKVMVDVSQSNSEEWSTLAQISLARGLFALVDPYTPIWIVQRAGQNAHLWPGFREQPIFTRHIDNQFNWLAPIALDPSWLIYYLANSGLGIESNLEATILAAVVHSVGPEALEVRPGPKGLRFTVPQPGEFFLLPDDVVQKYID